MQIITSIYEFSEQQALLIKIGQSEAKTESL